MNRKQYSTKSPISKVLRVIFISLAIFAAYTVMAPQFGDAWDVSCPMANAQISWEQSFHAGAPEVGR